MKLRPILLIPPAGEVVATEFARKAANVDTAEDDDLFALYIADAVKRIDGIDGLLGGGCLLAQTWKQAFTSWCWRVELPLFPVTVVNSVKYYAEGATVLTTLSASFYRLQQGAAAAYVEFDEAISFPSLATRDDAIEVEFVAGHADAAAIPPQYKLHVARLAAHWYETRDIASLPPGWNEPLGQFRRWPV